MQLACIIVVRTHATHGDGIINKFNKVVQLRSQDKETLPSTIGEELKVNPFMRCNELVVRKAAENYSNAQLSEPHEILGSIRNWKDNF